MQTETPTPPRPSRPARRAAAVGASLVVHAGALAVLVLTGRREAPPPVDGPVLDVALAPAPKPIPQPAPKPALQPAPPDPSPVSAKAAQPRAAEAATAAPARKASTRPRPSTLPSLPAGHGGAGVAAGDDAVGDAELAGAAVAGAGAGGGGGGACDMAARLQAALRRDRLVREAVAPLSDPPHRAFRVWNGDWVAHGGQDGRGLAAVREAILWEVGFSPPACRSAVVHGLVVLAVPSDGGGDVRLALGKGEWRWSDLLGLRAPSAG